MVSDGVEVVGVEGIAAEPAPPLGAVAAADPVAADRVAEVGAEPRVAALPQAAQIAPVTSTATKNGARRARVFIARG
jgi:hypothetical protein